MLSVIVAVAHQVIIIITLNFNGRHSILQKENKSYILPRKKIKEKQTKEKNGTVHWALQGPCNGSLVWPGKRPAYYTVKLAPLEWKEGWETGRKEIRMEWAAECVGKYYQGSVPTPR